MLGQVPGDGNGAVASSERELAAEVEVYRVYLRFCLKERDLRGAGGVWNRAVHSMWPILDAEKDLVAKAAYQQQLKLNDGRLGHVYYYLFRSEERANEWIRWRVRDAATPSKKIDATAFLGIGALGEVYVPERGADPESVTFRYGRLVVHIAVDGKGPDPTSRPLIDAWIKTIVKRAKESGLAADPHHSESGAKMDASK
jgi:hypothetical protein